MGGYIWDFITMYWGVDNCDVELCRDQKRIFVEEIHNNSVNRSASSMRVRVKTFGSHHLGRAWLLQTLAIQS